MPACQRQLYHAMVNYADAMVGNVTAALKKKGMYGNLRLASCALPPLRASPLTPVRLPAAGTTT